MLELYDANESVIWPDGMNANRARLQLSQIDTPSATAGSPQSDQGCRLEPEMVGEPISAGEAMITGQVNNGEDITAWIRDVRAKYSINTATDNSVTIGRGGDDYSVQAVAIQDSISTAVANSVTNGSGTDVISSQADAFKDQGQEHPVRTVPFANHQSKDAAISAWDQEDVAISACANSWEHGDGNGDVDQEEEQRQLRSLDKAISACEQEANGTHASACASDHGSDTDLEAEQQAMDLLDETISAYERRGADEARKGDLHKVDSVPASARPCPRQDRSWGTACSTCQRFGPCRAVEASQPEEPDAKRQKQSTLGGASKDIDWNPGVVEDSLADEFERAFDSVQTSEIITGEEASIHIQHIPSLPPEANSISACGKEGWELGGSLHEQALLDQYLRESHGLGLWDFIRKWGVEATNHQQSKFMHSCDHLMHEGNIGVPSVHEPPKLRRLRGKQDPQAFDNIERARAETFGCGMGRADRRFLSQIAGCGTGRGGANPIRECGWARADGDGDHHLVFQMRQVPDAQAYLPAQGCLRRLSCEQIWLQAQTVEGGAAPHNRSSTRTRDNQTDLGKAVGRRRRGPIA